VNQGGILNGNDASQWAFGADYNLSKRTALYATVSAINNNDTSYVVSSTTPLNRGNNSTGGEIGIRHSF
jgi:predicted porin